jgi:NAD(P)-dependent dehydrogenase (short-subunit alcohol dehydrogenase family)
MNTHQALFTLEDKVVVVTGASGILGAAFCRALCSVGASVVCLDLHEESLQKLTQEINCEYNKDSASFYVCDIASPDEVNKTVASIIEKFSKIDVLLNNAATKTDNLQSFFTSFDQYSLEVWREIMSVNLDGMFLMAQAVGAHMVNARQGSIIQTASIYSLLGPDQRIYEGSEYMGHEINTPAAYTVSKAGVVGLTKHLATLWGEYNIRVNALCPGGVSSGQNREFEKRYSSRVPLGRMAEQIDIVGPMLFLASNASKYMTGQVLYVDGGLSAW